VLLLTLDWIDQIVASMVDDANTDNNSEPGCLLCGQPLRVNMTLSLGPLVASNRFESRAHAPTETHPLSLTQCDSCNLVQLSKFPPAEFVCPRVPWVRYNEPVMHLEAVADQLQRLFSLKAACVMGVGPFDGPLLNRLQERGFSRVELDLSSRLPNAQGRYPYLESIQELLRPDILTALTAEQGTADLVCCRYLLEHSHHPVETLEGLRHLVKANGFLLIEVPDSTKFLSKMDYSFIWEEHICYFTEETFRTCALRAGYEVTNFFRYPGALEDALVFILRTQLQLVSREASTKKTNRLDIFLRYRAEFENIRKRYVNSLENIITSGRKVVIFGAGHQSIMFINALGLQRYIAFVIDDAPEKVGYLIPGTAIEIVPSTKLMNDRLIDVCLLGVGPAVEEKIRRKCAAYLDRGGRMYSIFPAAGSGILID
jgi:SAM-dependent methyltransferase